MKFRTHSGVGRLVRSSPLALPYAIIRLKCSNDRIERHDRLRCDLFYRSRPQTVVVGFLNRNAEKSWGAFAFFAPIRRSKNGADAANGTVSILSGLDSLSAFMLGMRLTDCSDVVDTVTKPRAAIFVTVVHSRIFLWPVP